MWRKQNHKHLASKRLQHRLLLLKKEPADLPLRTDCIHPAQNRPAKTAVYARTCNLPQNKQVFQMQGAKTQIALTTLGLGLLSMGAAFGLSHKTRKTNMKKPNQMIGPFQSLSKSSTIHCSKQSINR